MQAQLMQAQKMEAVGLLAGGLAHDFNNLLTAIQGYTEMMIMKFNKRDPLYKNLKYIHDASTQGASLIRQLLLFSRRQPTKLISLNINKTIRGILKMLKRIIGEDIEIKTELDPELLSVRADEANIEQMIMNLVVNARDAMPKGGRVTIKSRNVTLDEKQCKVIPEAKPGNYVCFTVSDTGVGMDKETISHIFEPFFTTKGFGKGTGLGLSVVYGIIKQLEGFIDVKSKLGHGTTFDIYLPAISEKPKAERKEVVSTYEVTGKGERILLVEDEEAVRSFAKDALEGNGYIVFEAETAKEALDIFEKEMGNFLLVFSDMVLPDKDGLELVEQLSSKKPDLVVILTSGYTDDKSKWPEIKEKRIRFLQKPYGLTDLLRTVREAININ
ncbi:MAG: hybrid sensor histidine kinase/response regulator [Spirochaetes bacterium]|nr:MAG: hybrid sensor histidine kinase/response regulator [Spirochaetota bacterium]